MEKFMEEFELVIKMVMEATVLHEKSFNALCVSDEYERYILKADWDRVDNKPTLYITYDNVHGDWNIYHEVSKISRQEIVRLLEIWDDIASSFEED